jgi:hypothetical protein
MTEPLRLKYQLIELSVCDREQVKAGVYWRINIKRMYFGANYETYSRGIFESQQQV